MSIRDKLTEIDEEFLLADGLDDALIGYAAKAGSEDVALYDRNKVIDILMRDGMDEEEAEEYFDYNIQGAYVGERTPIFATLL